MAGTPEALCIAALCRTFARVKRWEELYNLLSDFKYIDTKISALGSQPLIEDYDLAFNADLITFEEESTA
jgi:hypothetical protein